MKYYFFTLVFFILSFNLSAQQYKPFPMRDAYWIYMLDNGTFSDPQFPRPRYRYIQLMFDGKDTTINGHTYKTIIQREYADSSLNPGQPIHSNKIANLPDTQVLAIREDNKKIKAYMLPGAGANYDTSEIVLYDFNYNVGDTIKTDYGSMYGNVITGSDSVLVSSAYHKIWRTNTVQYIIEGVGSGLGLYLLANGQNTVYLSCFNQAGYGSYSPDSANCFYIHKYGTPTGVGEVQASETEISVSPNPFTNEIIIKAQISIEVRLYNSIGQLVLTNNVVNSERINTSTLPAGVYYVEAVNKDKNFRIVRKMLK